MAQPHKYDIIKFDTAGNLDPVTLVLCYRSGERIGAINNYTGFTVSNDMGNPQEISFSITKRVTWIWDKVVDFLVVWVVEWDRYFEISTPIDESISSIKNVTGMHLAEAELSQALIHDAEFGTENDIEYSDNKDSGYSTLFYDKDNQKYSLLHRLFADKGMNFEIVYVDESLWNDSREFSFDGTSLYDALMEIAEEVRCIFVFDTCTAEDGSIRRLVYVYDLEFYCNECDYRGEFEEKCPKCGNTNIKPGFGEDTTIFLSRENLVNSVSYSVDKDSVKNCFKLESGDEGFDTALKNVNPAGSMYIWHIPKDERLKMSNELQVKLNEYDNMYDCTISGKKTDGSKYDDAVYVIDANEYNNLVAKYSDPDGLWNYDTNPIPSECVGFTSLINCMYDAIDFELYLKTSMMPSPEMSDVPKATEVLEEVISYLKDYGVAINGNYIGDVTATNAIRNMAEAVMDSRFKLTVECTSITDTREKTVEKINNVDRDVFHETWTGIITVDAYATPEDCPDEDREKYTATQSGVEIHVSTHYEEYLKNVAEKMLSNSNTEDYSIRGLFEKPLDSERGEGQENSDTFEYELTKYSLDMLKHFAECCKGVLYALQNHNASEKPADGSWLDLNRESSTYWKIFAPYEDRMEAINAELIKRENEIRVVTQINEKITMLRNEVNQKLDMASFLGEKCWKELNSFRREDVYSNSNFVSEGLNTSKLFEYVNDFLDAANKELVKSATLQHTISSDLKNLFLIPEFAPLLDHFEIGNWMRIEVNETFYKLRLLSYVIDYENFESSDVTFSDITKGLGVRSDVDSVISNMKKISGSYSYVARQAEKGNEAQQTTNNWLTNGWNSALAAIKNNDHEEITYDNYGLWCKSFDPITEKYSDKQARFTSNILAMTNDNWKTVSIGLGEHEYQYYNKDKELVVDTDYGLSAKFVTAGYVNGSQIIGGEIFSQNYTDNLGTYIDLNEGSFSFAGGKLKYTNGSLALKPKELIVDAESSVQINAGGTFNVANGNFSISKEGNVVIKGTIEAGANSKIGPWTIDNNSIHRQSSAFANSSAGSMYFGTSGLSITNVFQVNSSGKLTCTDADIKGTIKADKGYIGNLTLEGGALYSGTSSITSQTAGIYLGSNGFRQYKNSEAYVDIKDGVISAVGASIKGSIDADNIKANNKYSIYTGDYGDIPIVWADGIDALLTTVYTGIDRNPQGLKACTKYHLWNDQSWGLIANTTVQGDNVDIIGGGGIIQASGGGVQITFSNSNTGFQVRSDVTSSPSVMMIGTDNKGGFIQSVPTVSRTTNATPNVRMGTEGNNIGKFFINTESSRRFKHDIKDLNINDISCLYDVPVRTFKYNLDYLPSGERCNTAIPGFIAEELDEVLPIAVDHFEDGSAEMWNINIIVPCMLKLIQNNKKENDALKHRIEQLESLVNQLITG